jgi:hypothetical protein
MLTYYDAWSTKHYALPALMQGVWSGDQTGLDSLNYRDLVTLMQTQKWKL